MMRHTKITLNQLFDRSISSLILKQVKSLYRVLGAKNLLMFFVKIFLYFYLPFTFTYTLLLLLLTLYFYSLCTFTYTYFFTSLQYYQQRRHFIFKSFKSCLHYTNLKMNLLHRNSHSLLHFHL